MRRLMAGLAIFGACGGPAPEVGEVPDATSGQVAGSVADAEGLALCGADKVQDLLGQPISGLRGRFPEDARIIPPNSLITQDYRPGRMNVDLDAAGAVARIWCG